MNRRSRRKREKEILSPRKTTGNSVHNRGYRFIILKPSMVKVERTRKKKIIKNKTGMVQICLRIKSEYRRICLLNIKP